MFNGLLAQLPSGIKRIAGNTAWLFIDRVVRMGLGVVIGVWIARYLGPANFGAYSFAISFVAIFGTLTTLGLENFIPRDLVRCPTGRSETLGTAFVLRMSASVIILPLSIGAIWLLQPNDTETVMLVSILSFGLLFQNFDVIDSYFISEVKSKYTVWAKGSAFVIGSAMRFIFIEIKAPLWSFAIAQVVEFALAASGLIWVYKWSGESVSIWTARRARAVSMLAESWPVILSGMAIMIYMRIDMIMLKVMKGDAATGIYATATRLSEVWYFIPMAIVSSVTPAIIRSKDNPELYYRRIGKLFSLMTFVALVIGSGIAVSSEWIIRVLYSAEFALAAPVLAVQIWASVFVFLGVAQGPWNIAENLTKLYFYRTLTGAVTNVVLNLWLIPRYSSMGAAIATVIAYAVAGVFSNAFDKRTRPIFFLQLKSFTPGMFWKA